MITLHCFLLNTHSYNLIQYGAYLFHSYEYQYEKSSTHISIMQLPNQSQKNHSDPYLLCNIIKLLEQTSLLRIKLTFIIVYIVILIDNFYRIHSEIWLNIFLRNIILIRVGMAMTLNVIYRLMTFLVNKFINWYYRYHNLFVRNY